MPRAIRQATFAGGEIAPTLHARTDLAKYFNSLRTCRNLFVTQHGALMNRPGTRLVHETKDSGPVRLVPFIFSNDQTFVMEFGARYIRLHHDGAICVGPATTKYTASVWGPLEMTFNFAADVPIEILTPYAVDELPALKFAQMGDVVTIVHPNHKIYELKRFANDNWTMAPVSVSRPASPTGLAFHFPDPSGVRGVDPTNNVAAYSDIYSYQGGFTCLGPINENPIPDIHIFRSLQDNNLGKHTHDAANIGIWWVDEGTAAPSLNHLDTPGRPARDWRWVITVVSTTGVESLPTAELNPSIDAGNPSNNDKVCLATDREVRLKWDAAADAKFYKIYRGRNGLFGYVGESTDPSFTDDAQTPDYTHTPPTANEPFSADGDYPSTIAYFQQRRWFGGTRNNPQTIWGSKTGDFYNFDKSLIPKADDSVEFTLASRYLEKITNLLGLRSLLMLTTSAEWSVSGGQAGPITPSNVEMQPHSYRGSTYLEPIPVGNVALYVQAMGNIVRELTYDYSSDSYTGNDLTILATHLFQGYKIVDWAFAPLPYSILWAVRDDGALLGCTYLREHEMIAWHRHDTGNGDKFENVCAVPENGEHAVYVVVSRGGKRYIERFASRSDEMFLDSAILYEAKTTFAGLDHLEGREVMVLADGNVAGPYVVNAGTIDLSADFPDGVTTVQAGLGYVSEAETLDLAVQGADLRSAFKSVIRANIELLASRGLAVGIADGSTRKWRQRSVSDNWDPVKPFTGFLQVQIPSAYGRDARLVLRQEEPLPCTILGIGREVDVS